MPNSKYTVHRTGILKGSRWAVSNIVDAAGRIMLQEDAEELQAELDKVPALEAECKGLREDLGFLLGD